MRATRSPPARWSLMAPNEPRLAASAELCRIHPGTPRRGRSIYISLRYSTASHLCCCGCGLEVVTPLNPAKWRLTERAGAVSLVPSIGNWSFPCRSHYWITANRVRWAGAMSPEIIAAVKARDRVDAAEFARHRTGRIRAMLLHGLPLLKKARGLFRSRSRK
jgi:hypothetical protein